MNAQPSIADHTYSRKNKNVVRNSISVLDMMLDVPNGIHDVIVETQSGPVNVSLTVSKLIIGKREMDRPSRIAFNDSTNCLEVHDTLWGEPDFALQLVVDGGDNND